MNKKKNVVLIIGILMLGLFIAVGSYAYWSWKSAENKNIVFNTSKDLQEYIVYDEGESKFVGDFKVSDTYLDGVHTTISIYKKSEARDIILYASIYMRVNEIGTNLANSEGLKWVVTKGNSTSNGEVLAEGDFVGHKNKDEFMLLDGIEVTETLEEYTIWLWLDSKYATEEMSGEKVDTSIWTQVDQYAEDNFEITSLVNDYQIIKATVVNSSNNIVSYAVTNSNTEPTTWIDIPKSEQRKIYNLSHVITSTGTYYVWFKDTVGKTVNDKINVNNISTSAPICTWESPSKDTLKDGETATISLTCIDTSTVITKSEITSSDIALSSNSISISNDIIKKKVTNGYKYTFTVTGTDNTGSSTLTLKDNVITNTYNVGNNSVVSSNITVQNLYTVTFNGNMFSIKNSQTINGLTLTYDYENSYLTINGTPTSSSTIFGYFSGLTFNERDKYALSLTYISGDYTYTGTGENNLGVEVMNSTNDNLSTRVYANSNYPASGSNDSILVVNSLAASEGTGIKYALWFNEPKAATFNNYKIKVNFTKIESKELAFGSTYGNMPMPNRLGFTFDGWYTGENGAGTKITKDSVASLTSDQTLYAKWVDNIKPYGTAKLEFGNHSVQPFSDIGTATPISTIKLVLSLSNYGDDGSGLTNTKGFALINSGSCENATYTDSPDASISYPYDPVDNDIYYGCIKLTDNAGNVNYLLTERFLYTADRYNVPDSYTYIVPVSGYYKLQLWGASGGGSKGGSGAYTYGWIKLNKNEKLYINVGGQGDSYGQGGYNGGGNAGVLAKNNDGGGGASDIRYNDSNINDRIMVAAGGGGANANGTNTSGRGKTGGSGGGLTGYAGTSVINKMYGTGATQIDGGLAGSTSRTPGTDGLFGFGGIGGISKDTPTVSGGAGGGGGYYGGGSGEACASNCGGSGGGGSSYISGHTGCVAITSSTSTAPRTGTDNASCTTGTTDNLCSVHYSGKKFELSLMIDGNGYEWTNTKGELESMPNPNGGDYGSGVGHTGDGVAKITLDSSFGESKLAYDNNGGSGCYAKSIVSGEAYGSLCTPVREGYRFDGWYTAISGGTKINKDDIVDGSITLYAHWIKTTLPTIAFGQNGNDDYVLGNVFSTIVASKGDADLDPDSFKYIYSKDSNAAPTNNFTNNSTYTLEGATGIYYLIAKACDVNGNCTTEVSDPFYVDNSEPTASIVSLNQENNTVIVNISANDSDSGIKDYGYLITTSSTCPTNGYTTSTNSSYNFNLTESGKYYVCVKITDNVGNSKIISDSISVSVSITYSLLSNNYSCANASAGTSPVFTYTGDCEVVDSTRCATIENGEDDYCVRFLTSGTLTFNANVTVDAFLVGGGGGGYYGTYASGGGGGYTQTQEGIIISANTDYSIVIGNGGKASKDGESSTAFGYTVDGGKAGGSNRGGAGGSGGGKYNGGIGGSDGANGGNNGGAGQGTTTREFGEPTGNLYAGGGGANGSKKAVGGDGGGGNGQDAGGSRIGTVNTGGGGGGCSGVTNTGGSGIVIIRNARITPVTYNNNGGSGCTSAVFSGTYGEFCIPEREGYYFAGWYTEKDGGTRKKSTDIVDTSVFNLYAHWSSEVNYYTISSNYSCANIYNGNKTSQFMNYTGNCELVDDADGNWKVRFLTDGELTFSESLPIDVFLVGGGAGGARGQTSVDNNGVTYYNHGGGGGGGYTKTVRNQLLNKGQSYAIEIGAGGEACTKNNCIAKAGSNTQAFGITASGGLAGTSWRLGSNGGSGGGSGGENWLSTGVKNSIGAIDGLDAEASHFGEGGKGQISTPGPNGETGSTREFGEDTGDLYAAGGTGGAGAAVDGAANTGNGGGGNRGTGNSGAGGSGIVVIRNARKIPVTYNNNGGSGCTSASFSVSGTYGEFCIPEREGYYFAGWYTATSDGTRKKSTDAVDTSVSNLYARWSSEVNYYTISSNYNCANIYNGDKTSQFMNYTGNCEVVDDADGNWKIKFLTDGELTLLETLPVDVFLVGGGASGGSGSTTFDSSQQVTYYDHGGGGGSGYTKTVRNQILNHGQSYAIEIGAGGEACTVKNCIGKAGSNTQAFGITVSGGLAGTNWRLGSNGGSGGGSGGHHWVIGSYKNSVGATDGLDAEASYFGEGGKGQISTPGPNGETGSTREFGEDTGDLYATGGTGGAGASVDGAANTGNGGGGNRGTGNSGAGGSGIVVIRNKR